jgi:hypothetical protein
MNEYPPQPWQLKPNAWISVWRVPVELAKGVSGRDVAPFQVFGSAVLCSGFVEYRAGGDLEYRECFLAALTRGWGVSLPLIWVDSEPALRGGIELWAIPKQPANFEFRWPTFVAQDADDRIAELFIQRIAAWSLPFRAKATIVQNRDGDLIQTPARIRARICFAQANWSFSENGPLACLRTRQPWFSCAITESDMQVGA